MTKIDKIHLNNLRNHAYFQFQTEFNDLVTRFGAETLNVKPLFDVYLPLYRRVDDAFKKVIKSYLTEQIQDADKDRDEIWYGIVDTNKGALRHFNPEVRAAAKRLDILFNNTYGNIAKLSLNEETSAIYNISQELCGSYAADVAKVGLGQWVTELQIRNSAFDNLMKERYDETAAKCNTILKEARAELDRAYRAIVERINALIVVNGDAEYEVFVRTLNAIIAKYVLMKGKRHSEHGNSTLNSTEVTDEN